jgi:hypothetical protein
MRLGVGVTAVSVAFGDVKGYLSLQVGTLAGDSLRASFVQTPALFSRQHDECFAIFIAVVSIF